MKIEIEKGIPALDGFRSLFKQLQQITEDDEYVTFQWTNFGIDKNISKEEKVLNLFYEIMKFSYRLSYSQISNLYKEFKNEL